MLQIKIKGSFSDIDRRWVDVSCPYCPLTTEASLRDIRLGNVVLCRGCKANIRLVDHLGEYNRAHRRLQGSFKRMFDALKG